MGDCTSMLRLLGRDMVRANKLLLREDPRNRKRNIFSDQVYDTILVQG